METANTLLRQRPVQTPVSNLQLVHFSHKKIDEIENRIQSNAPNPKPKGLWVSVENSNLGWKEWCDCNEFDGNWDFAYSVKLNVNANILLLDNVNKIDDFTQKFSSGKWIINWKDIAKDYDGVIISPYQWSRRLDHNTSWYYGWDCASGCIWNAKAIKKILRFNADLKKCC